MMCVTFCHCFRVRRAGIDAILLDAANLYEGNDCVRIRSMSGLIASLMPSLRDSDFCSIPQSGD